MVDELTQEERMGIYKIEQVLIKEFMYADDILIGNTEKKLQKD